MCRPLVRRLRLISGFCSSARTFDPRFLQTPPRDGSPCVSLTLHLHQVGWKTFTSELLSMPGTRLNRSRGRALRPAAGPCQQWMERWERLARCDWRCSDYGEGCIRRARNRSLVGSTVNDVCAHHTSTEASMQHRLRHKHGPCGSTVSRAAETNSNAGPAARDSKLSGCSRRH